MSPTCRHIPETAQLRGLLGLVWLKYLGEVEHEDTRAELVAVRLILGLYPLKAVELHRFLEATVLIVLVASVDALERRRTRWSASSGEPRR